MMKFNPQDTALIVVDMQNDFAHPDGELFAPPSGEVKDMIVSLVEKAHDAGTHIVYTQDTHTEEQFEDVNYYDEYERWGKHVEKGSWGAQIIDELKPSEFADKIVQKKTYNAFYETELDEWLEDRGVTSVIVCGTLANVCVLHTASGAGLRDYKPVIVEDALGYLQEDDKEYAVEHANWLFGEKINQEKVQFV